MAKGCLAKDLTPDNCFLLFRVQRDGDDAPVMASLRDLEDKANFPALVHFVKQHHASKRIPVPGEVDMIQGGPPCQGMSGLNRHRANTLEQDARWILLNLSKLEGNHGWFQISVADDVSQIAHSPATSFVFCSHVLLMQCKLPQTSRWVLLHPAIAIQFALAPPGDYAEG